MRIKHGIQAWSTLSAMLFSLVVISGCNTEDTPSTNPPSTSPSSSTSKPAEPPKKPDTTTPPPPATDKAKEPGKS